MATPGGHVLVCKGLLDLHNAFSNGGDHLGMLAGVEVVLILQLGPTALAGSILRPFCDPSFLLVNIKPQVHHLGGADGLVMEQSPFCKTDGLPVDARQLGINPLKPLTQVLEHWRCMGSIVDLLIHLRGNLFIVYVQGGLVVGCRGGSPCWAARGSHLAFGLCITVNVEPGLQVKVFVTDIILVVPFDVAQGNLPELLQDSPGLLRHFTLILGQFNDLGFPSHFKDFEDAHVVTENLILSIES